MDETCHFEKSRAESRKKKKKPGINYVGKKITSQRNQRKKRWKKLEGTIDCKMPVAVAIDEYHRVNGENLFYSWRKSKLV